MSPRRNTAATLRLRRTTLTVAALAAAVIAACADGPVAPRAMPAATPAAAPSDAPNRAIALTTSPGATAVSGLLWEKPASLASASRVIGAGGGSVAIAGGIKLVVPKGAVPGNTSFTVTRLPGSIVAYDFQPHGTRFAVPVQLELPVEGIDLSSLAGATSLQAAYFSGLSALDQLTGTALVSEFQPTVVSADKKTVRFTVQHFSGYMVSTGRR